MAQPDPAGTIKRARLKIYNSIRPGTLYNMDWPAIIGRLAGCKRWPGLIQRGLYKCLPGPSFIVLDQAIFYNFCPGRIQYLRWPSFIVLGRQYFTVNRAVFIVFCPAVFYSLGPGCLLSSAGSSFIVWAGPYFIANWAIFIVLLSAELSFIVFGARPNFIASQAIFYCQ